MSLANRLPVGITCEDWELDKSDAKGRRCSFFGVDGACPLHGRCTELEKREALRSSPPRVEPLMLTASSPPSPPSPPPAPPLSAADRARALYAAQLPAALVDAAIAPDCPPPPAAKEIDPERLAELAALSPEIHLVSPDLGDVYLVSKPTGSARRHELTFGQAATLRLLVDSFPGARVVELRPPRDLGVLGVAQADVRGLEIAVADPATLAAPKGWDQ